MSAQKKTGFKFEIEKHRIIGDDTRPFIHKGYFNPGLYPENSGEELVTEHEDYHCGNFIYNKDGGLTFFWDNEIERDDKENQSLIFDNHRFENAFIAVPNPFELGDFVRRTGGGESGIVAASRKENDERVKKALSGEWGAVDFFDSGITVDFLDKKGNFGHAHISPAFLEKFKPQKDDEDYDLLMTASAVYRGECTLDWFTRCYDDYKEKHSKK